MSEVHCGHQEWVPTEMLEGLLPQALLHRSVSVLRCSKSELILGPKQQLCACGRFEFWQDPDDNIMGYPIDIVRQLESEHQMQRHADIAEG